MATIQILKHRAKQKFCAKKKIFCHTWRNFFFLQNILQNFLAPGALWSSTYPLSLSLTHSLSGFQFSIPGFFFPPDPGWTQRRPRRRRQRSHRTWGRASSINNEGLGLKFLRRKKSQLVNPHLILENKISACFYFAWCCSTTWEQHTYDSGKDESIANIPLWV